MPKDFQERMQELLKEELTQKGKEKIRRERYAKEAEGLADKYLNISSYRTEDLARDLNRYEGNAKDIVTKVILSRFVENISLLQDDKKIMEGISALGNEYAERVESLQKEREQAIQQRYAQSKEEIERPVRERLNQLKISGSAIGEINVETSEAWHRILDEINSKYKEGLDKLKRELSY